MKITERRVRDFVLAILVALVAYALAGCDGGAGEEEGLLPDGGLNVEALRRTDAGVVTCEIPSPTGDVFMTDAHGNDSKTTRREYFTQVAATGSAGRWGVVVNAGEGFRSCVGESGNNPISTVDGATGKPVTISDPCDTARSFSDCVVTGTTIHYTKATQLEECKTVMTTSQCSDVEHDFVDSVGFKRCWVVSCDWAKDSSGQIVVPNTMVCTGALGGVLWTSEVEMALCDPQGRFVGWSCPSPERVSCS